jgi:hypothetical protein
MRHLTSKKRDATRRTDLPGLRFAVASADQRGFLVIYERPGAEPNLADVYELGGMAVVG